MKWIVIMALSVIGQFFLHASSGYSYSSPFTAGRTVKIFWDDSTNAFRVFLYDSAGVQITEALTGPTINQSARTRLLAVKNFGYSFCNVASLNEFYIENKTGSDEQNYSGNVLFQFPYGKRRITSNHWSCNPHVCDIEFDLTTTQVVADSGASDGTVTVKASSSAGLVKFSRDPNATYDTAEPGVSNTFVFAGLASGNYLLYAIDSFGCKAQIYVFVPTVEIPYGVRWRMLFQNLKGITQRVDIEEKEYTGEIIAVKGDGEPFIFNSGSLGDVNVFDTLKGSEVVINLISEIDNQFIELFTQDERKFRIRYYENPNTTSTDGFTPAVMPAVGTWAQEDYSVDDPGVAWAGLFVFPNAYSKRLFTPYTFVPGRTYNFDYQFTWTGFISSSARFYILITNSSHSDLGASTFIVVSGNTGDSQGTFSFVAPEGADRIEIYVFAKFFSGVEFSISQFDNTTPSISGTTSVFGLKWMGYVIPMLYSEPYYLDKNYAVSISATDQIGNLKALDFTDDYGNVLVGSMSFMDAICMILRKTDLNLQVRESVNIFEESMDTDPEDSSLQQAFFDATIYNGIDCDEALRMLLISFGARLFQAEGFWNVELIEEKGYTHNFRVFNTYSQYVTNGVISNVSNIKKATFTERSVLRDRSGMITIMPSYGVIRFLVKTFFNNNLLTTGNFEEADIANGQIIGWTFDLTNGTGINYGIETLAEERKGGKSALFIDFENTTAGREIILRPQQFDLVAINGPSLLFKFDILFRPYFKEIYSYIDISIKIGDNYASSAYLPGPGIDALLDDEYMRFYVDEALEWKTIEKKIATTFNRPTPDVNNVELSGPVVIKIRVSNNPTYDYSSITALRAQQTDPTAGPENGIQQNLTRVKVHDGDVLRIYEFNSDAKADDSPDVIRPNDYDSGTNQVHWKLIKTLKEPDTAFLLAGVLIDNVALTIETKYPETFPLEEAINEDIKQTLEVPVYHSDLEISSAQVVEGVDENAIRLSKAFIRLNDGTETKLWKRSYVTEARPLLDILMEMYKAQVTTPSLKLSGTFFTDVPTSMATSFYEAHLNKYFINNSHNNKLKINSFDAELLELKTGPGGIPPNPEVFEFTSEFSDEFNSAP